MEAPPLERKLAAIFAADVAGYSRLMEADEEETLATLSGHRRMLTRRSCAIVVGSPAPPGTAYLRNLRAFSTRSTRLLRFSTR
jgi:hypothetical protein